MRVVIVEETRLCLRRNIIVILTCASKFSGINPKILFLRC
ncbi:hypothetical protein DJ55_4038 [Yersinia pseudotuberculosis]|nr:hypothetical protein DJ55_4038 [Yersinia pseudotuberculosis]